MKAFTLIELIFVVVLIGILTFVGISYMPDNTLNDDAKALVSLIKLKESKALGYEADMSSEDKKNVCITFDKDSLNQEENSSKVKYFFKSSISSDYSTVCFDKFGRVFENEVDSKNENLIHKNVTITLQYRNQSKTITIYNITGYAE